MNAQLVPYRARIAELCARHHVRRLDLFGSAAGPDFDPSTSDIDLLVEFADLSPAEYANAFFALREGLVALFGREVDLVVERAVKNPYFLESVGRTREHLFAA